MTPKKNIFSVCFHVHKKVDVVSDFIFYIFFLLLLYGRWTSRHWQRYLEQRAKSHLREFWVFLPDDQDFLSGTSVFHFPSSSVIHRNVTSLNVFYPRTICKIDIKEPKKQRRFHFSDKKISQELGLDLKLYSRRYVRKSVISSDLVIRGPVIASVLYVKVTLSLQKRSVIGLSTAGLLRYIWGVQGWHRVSVILISEGLRVQLCTTDPKPPLNDSFQRGKNEWNKIYNKFWTELWLKSRSEPNCGSTESLGC